MAVRTRYLITAVMACVLVVFVSPFSSGAVPPVQHPTSEQRAPTGACVAQTPGYNQCRIFRADSSAQTFTPPAAATAVRFHLWGDGGGPNGSASAGGVGGHTQRSVSAPLSVSYSINVPAARGTADDGKGAGGDAAWVKDASGTLLLVAGGDVGTREGKVRADAPLGTGGVDDPFYGDDRYGTPRTAGAAVVEWRIPAVNIESPKDGDTIGPTIEFTGTGAPGARVALTRGSSTVGTATVGGDGRWAVVATGQSTSSGPVTYTATQTLAGQTTLTHSVSVRVVGSGSITGSPVTLIRTSNTGGCQADYRSTKQFYGSGACGTGIGVGSSVYGGVSFVQSSSSASTKAVNQTPTTGTGTVDDPFTMTTDFTAADVLRLSQRETYVNGENGFRVDITVTNYGTRAQSGHLYRGGDCYLQGSDNSYGVVLPAAPGRGNGIACVKNADGTGQAMMFVPLTPGSSYMEGRYSTVSSQIGTGRALPNTCQCGSNLDSGMAISWPYSLESGASQTFSFFTYFRPADVKPMQAEKTVSPGRAKPGDTVTYTVKITNPNTYPVTTFGFTDTLDSRLDYVADSTRGMDLDEPTVTGSQVGWATFTTLPAGESSTFTFQAKVKTTATPGTATNDFSGDGIAALSKAAPLVIAPGANLTVAKTVDKPKVPIGGQAVFTVTVRNDGPNAAANVVLTDRLPTGLTWVSDDSAGTYDRTSGQWKVGALAKDATATLRITVRGAQEGEFLNAVTALTSDTINDNPLCADASDPATCPNAKLLVRTSDLAITAGTSPNPVVPGGTSTATLTVTNNGPSTTGDAATVTFTLPQRTKPGAPLPSGCTAATDGTSVTCTVAAGLARDARAVLAIPLVVDSNAPVAAALSGGSAVVTSADDPRAENDTAAVPLSTTAKGVNDLAMSATSPTAPVIPGTAGTVTGTVRNGGPSDTTSVSTVTFTMPDHTTAAAPQPEGCMVTAGRKSVTCTIPAGLRSGATASFAVSVVVDPNAPLDTALSDGRVTVANAEDPAIGNNSAPFVVRTTETAEADLAIKKKVDDTTPVVLRRQVHL
ncbi:isopeptide-forming domain-containing fimbrial protein [Streptomyces sp. CC208A]|uniref:isopeptide-forming domain-containing fimbrial protein n=1 Tax=Streptomyces sp. CC208A TaxID=3044573 RepID=UPI0024A92E46|nr:isopeptide-forming domain-containing fimbrial protein [Streptomyces sp. CC208A]